MPLAISKDSIDLGLVTDNIEAMTTFYKDTLGLELEAVLDMPGGMQMTRLLAGTSVIKLVTFPTAPEPQNPPGGIMGGRGIRYFTITIDNLTASVEACTVAGYACPIPVRESRPGVNIAMVEDPDGNWVELLQQGDL